MDFFYGFIKKYWYYVVIVFLLLSLAGTTFYFLQFSSIQKEVEVPAISYVDREKEEQISDVIYVDLKGAVKNPGVYKVDNKNIINDVIKLAGGFTKKAYTKNINLSKKVKNEMVIYVYTESEYNKLNVVEETVEECICNTYVIEDCVDSGSSIVVPSEDNTDFPTNKEESEIKKEEEKPNVNNADSKISINKASKEELMILNGIGEAKAMSIIEYRQKNGGFKTIDEIMNVSGIGEAAFAKIKDDITI